MFKVTSERINNAPMNIRLIAVFTQPQTVVFAGSTIEAKGIVLEPNGYAFLITEMRSSRKGKKSYVKKPFEEEPIPRGKENPNITYTLNFLRQEQTRLKIEATGHDNKIEFGRPPLEPGFAYSA